MKYSYLRSIQRNLRWGETGRSVGGKKGAVDDKGLPGFPEAHFGSALLLAILTIFCVLYIPFVVRYGWEYQDNPNYDLPTFYSASISVFENGESPYNPDRLRRMMPNEKNVFPYLYPPPSLLFFAPLSLMTYADARNVVLLVNHLLFLILVWVIPLFLCRPGPGSVFNVTVVCIVVSLTWYPATQTLMHAQVNILFAVLIIMFWLFARERKAVWAALFLALAIILKTYPLMIIPFLILIRRWRESVYTIVWLSLGVFSSLVVLPDKIWNDWIVNVLPYGGYLRTPPGLFSPAAIWNQNLNGYFARSFTESRWSSPLIDNPDLARALTYSAAFLIVTVTAAVVWRSYRLQSDCLDRTMLVVIPTMFLIAPFSWTHHVVYLLPSMLLLLNSRSSLAWLPRLTFHSLCIGSAIVLGMEQSIPFKFYGAVGLWGLGVFVAFSKEVSLPTSMNGYSRDQRLEDPVG